VAAAGTTEPVIGPADVPVAEGQATIVYAIGSLEEGSLGVAVQTIGGLHSAPGSVPAGSGGLADTGSSAPVWALALVGTGLVGLVADDPSTGRRPTSLVTSARRRAPCSASPPD
jgi:hypothetical protein